MSPPVRIDAKTPQQHSRPMDPRRMGKLAGSSSSSTSDPRPSGGEFLNELRYRYISTKNPVKITMAGISSSRTAIFIWRDAAAARGSPAKVALHMAHCAAAELVSIRDTAPEVNNLT